MWNLCEVFADNADKARLVTALLSVLAALGVVFLTHALAQKRSRMELNAKKMEELYSAITDFSNAGWRYIHERAGPNGETLVTTSVYDEAHRKCEMLASIYADDISSEIEKMNEMVILTKEHGAEDLSIFPAKLQEFIGAKSKVLEKVASRARRLV